MENVASCDASIPAVMLESVCEGLGAAVFVYDRNDHILFASQLLLQFFCVPPQVLAPGTRLRDFLGAVHDSGARHSPGASPERGIVGREEWISGRIAHHWKERNERVERWGQDRWMRLVKRRLPSGMGICIVRDISEEKKREEQWRADLERVQLTEEILDSLPFAVSVKDRNLAYAAVNRAMCEHFGKAPEDILGRTDREIFSPEVASLFELSDRRVMDTGGAVTFPEHLKRGDGSELLFLVHKLRVGKPGRGFLVTIPQDVTGLAASARLENAICAGDAEQDPAIRPDYTTLQALAGHRLLLVTGDRGLEEKALRTLSRLGFDACSVRSTDELAAFLDVAGTAGVRIDLIVLDNEMDMACLELAERYGVDALPLDAFQIASELAFAVARRLNRGRRPQPSPAGAEAASGFEISTGSLDVPQPVLPGLDVLVAEDNDINRIVFSQILEGLGHSYVLAATAEETVRLWRERKPRIVLMDLTLPDMSGGEAARRIRAEEAASGGRVPIVGVLPRAADGDREACLADGMDETILKPLSSDMIEALIRRFFGAGLAAAAS